MASNRRLLKGLQPLGRAAGQARRRLDRAVGGPARSRVILVLACILALNSADTATVGAAAAPLRHALGISNLDIGLLVAVTSAVGALASIPFGALVDRHRRTRILAWTIVLWGVAMLGSASVSSFGSLLLARVFLGAVTAAAGPAVASLVGDFFPSAERGKIYSYILSGELVGAGIGFVISGDLAALSWRVPFIALALPAALLAWIVYRLPEPARGGASRLSPGAPRVVGAAELRGQPAPATAGGGAAPGAEQDGPIRTDAQQVAAEKGIAPDPELVLRRNPNTMRIVDAARYVLRIRTNVILIIAGACGYYFLAGVETFGLEFAREQYGLGQVLASLMMLVLGAGALLGVLAGGRAGDYLLHRRYLNGRVLVAAIAALATVLLFIPVLLTRSVATALPYVVLAAFALTAQNPAIDAARLDIMPPLLWGRAEGIRTCLRTGAQAIAPLLFGAVSGLFGGGRSGLDYTFILMLLPLAASGVILLMALRRYPQDVATAAAARSPRRDRVA